MADKVKSLLSVMGGVYGLEQCRLFFLDELQYVILVIDNEKSHALGIEVDLISLGGFLHVFKVS